ncbi:MAG: hypothetical protein A3H27_01480 [Acidobacteria bacterium RIFCSPLOWO2_02_FULL_59_13]|nr:MAG: hypothetical protein A3H27_01480 [Acidobacteria bacterium RIFCSPLOWO2_02_FULL_59_13]OFW44579.1 MAG: hypothetical protein A3J28_06430 [Acidobacteria bacterium RIFCSPLOWO2_12_FULL_60_22]
MFAVALGMQQGSARGVWRALPPIALGHAVAVSVVLLAVGLLQMVAFLLATWMSKSWFVMRPTLLLPSVRSNALAALW